MNAFTHTRVVPSQSIDFFEETHLDLMDIEKQFSRFARIPAWRRERDSETCLKRLLSSGEDLVPTTKETRRGEKKCGKFVLFITSDFSQDSEFCLGQIYCHYAAKSSGRYLTQIFCFVERQ